MVAAPGDSGSTGAPAEAAEPGARRPSAAELGASFAVEARAVARGRIRARLMSALRIAFAVAGVGAVALLVRDTGAHELAAILVPAARWIPLILALEVIRIALDGVATWLALGRRAQGLPVLLLTRAQIIGAAVGSLAPAGRAAAEATKAALIAPWTGGAAATAAAATVQAATLLAVALISIPCAWAAWVVTGPSLITVSLVVHAAVLLVLGAGMRLAMRAPRLGRFIERRAGRFARGAASFQDAARETPVLAPGPTAVLFVGRVLQVAQYAALAYAAGIDVTAVQALVSQGLNLISLSVGALVPGQVGVSEGAFVLSANAIGATEAKAMAIALLAHVLQVAVIPLGALTPVLWKVRRPEPDAPREIPEIADVEARRASETLA